MLGMFILALGLFFFFLAYQRRLFKQQKRHQQKEAEYQLQLLRANLLSQEKERNRIGKDLHDEVGAMLTTSKLYFRHLDQASSTTDFKQIKEKALNLLDETMSSVRRVSHDLRPVVLERLGLVEAIANMADQINETGEVKLSFKCKWQAEMDKEYELNWFRIIQELINNTLKHAQAQKIKIHLSGDGNLFKMVYKDDGIGMDVMNSSGHGLGMQNIESRLSLMGGRLIYIDTEGKGLGLEMTSQTKPMHSAASVQNNES